MGAVTVGYKCYTFHLKSELRGRGGGGGLGSVGTARPGWGCGHHRSWQVLGHLSPGVLRLTNHRRPARHGGQTTMAHQRPRTVGRQDSTDGAHRRIPNGRKTVETRAMSGSTPPSHTPQVKEQRHEHPNSTRGLRGDPPQRMRKSTSDGQLPGSRAAKGGGGVSLDHVA